MDKIRTQLRLISGLAFLRPLLRETGFDIDEGLVLLFDTKKIAQRFLAECVKNVNAIEVGSLKKNVNAENFEAGFHIFRSSDDPDLLVDFLRDKDFLPVLISGGKIPTCLEEPYIIRISFEFFDNIIHDFSEEFNGFRNYVIQNVSLVVQRIKTVNLSQPLEMAAVDNEEVLILQTFLAVGVIWYDFTQSVTPNQDFFNDFFWQCSAMVKKMRDFSDHVDLEDEIADLTFEYMENHPELQIISVEEVTDEGQKAIEACEAILFDDDFYYIPERLVKWICAPLLATKPVGVLKEELAKEGIIVCNLDGYTVKKKYWTVDGNSNRMRAIKFVKDMLITREGLALEELVFNKEEEEVSCILEK